MADLTQTKLEACFTDEDGRFHIDLYNVFTALLSNVPNIWLFKWDFSNKHQEEWDDNKSFTASIQIDLTRSTTAIYPHSEEAVSQWLEAIIEFSDDHDLELEPNADEDDYYGFNH